MQVRHALRRAVLAGTALAALAAPSAMAAPQMVANAMPGAPSLSPSGNMSSIRIDCAATDPLAVSVEIHCWTSNGADARKSDAKAVYTGDTVYTGAVGIAFSSFTLCAQATSTFADGHTESTPVGCVADDFGFATVL
jgi:hypothetical protein